jgi:lysophospholipase L1-like esterase
VENLLDGGSQKLLLALNVVRNYLLIFVLVLVPHLMAARQNNWIAAWASSPQSSAPDPEEPLMNLEDQTVRQRVRVSLGGRQIRIRLSNEFSPSPVVIGSVTVAVPSDAANVQSTSIQPVTFSGRKSVTIPLGAPVLSDPVSFPVDPGEEISISLYLPRRVVTPTWHELALKRAVVSKHGDHSADDKMEAADTSESSILLSAVLVPAQPSQRLVVALGDSITDGDKSTVDADHNWPGDLIRRLTRASEPSNIAVINEGIVGNRLLSDCFLVEIGCFSVSALARFDRDVLGVPGVTHVVLLEGSNDIGFPGAKLGATYLADPADLRTAENVIDAYRQLIDRAHAHGIEMIGATLTPCEGVPIPGYYSEAKEKIRQEVNKWIRSSGSFDAVIDFDAVLRDPDHPSRLLPKFASQDHLHPNDAGYQAMADAIDLKMFN